MSRFDDWLAPELEHEISEGLEWRNENTESKNKVRHSQVLEQMYRDDGSNLRFAYATSSPEAKVHVFQLLQDHHNPDQEFVDALVSDTHTSIKVRFSSSFIRNFRKESPDVLKRLQGAVFVLKEVEIVVAYVGAMGQDKVYLLITDAQYGGPSGLPMIGRPSPIHERSKIEHLLSKLNEDSADVDDDDSADENMESQSGRKSPLSSQNPDEDDSAIADTQFGTQMITSAIRPKKNPTMDTSRLSQSTAVPVNGNPLDVLQKTLSRHQSDNSAETAKRNGTGAQASTITKIKVEQADPVPPRDLEATDENANACSRKNGVNGLDAVPPISTVELQSQLRNMRESTPVARSSIPRHGMHDQLSSPASSFRDALLVDAAKNLQEVPQSSMREADDAPTSFQAPLPENQLNTQTSLSSSNNFDVRNGLDRTLCTDGSQMANPSLPSSTSGPAQSSGSNAQGSNLKASRSIASSGPWQGTSRISRAVGRIPEDQELILDNNQSAWLPPPAGTAFLKASLPEHVLSWFSNQTEEAEKEPKTQQISTGNSTGVEACNSQAPSAQTVDDKDGGAGNEDEPSDSEPAPSGQTVTWSSSPVRSVARLADREIPPSSVAEQQFSERSVMPAANCDELRVDSSAEKRPLQRTSEVMITNGSQRQPRSQHVESAHDRDSADVRSSPPSAGAECIHEENAKSDLGMTALKSPPFHQSPFHQKTLGPTMSSAVTLLQHNDVSRVEETSYKENEHYVSDRRRDRNFMSAHLASSSHPPPRLEQKNEIESRVSQQNRRDTRRLNDERQRSIPGDVEKRTSSKRKGHSSSPEKPSSKRRSYAFSQESPVSQDPRENLQHQRREFHSKQKKAAQSEQTGDKDLVLVNLSRSDADGAHGDHNTTAAKKESGLEAPSSINQHKGLQPTQPSRPEMSRPLDQVNLEDAYDVFTQFKSAYPEYSGDRKHFEGLCHMLDWLRSDEGKGFPQSVWDDFVMRQKNEYRSYFERCADGGQDALPYWRFYLEDIYDVRHTKAILNKLTLAQVLERSDYQTSNPQTRQRSRSPVVEQQLRSDVFGAPATGYRERSPVPRPSINPTAAQQASPGQKDSVAEERRNSFAHGGPVSDYRERSPFSHHSASPTFTYHGSPGRRESLSVRARMSGHNRGFRGDSYRPLPRRPEGKKALEQSSPTQSSQPSAPPMASSLPQPPRNTARLPAPGPSKPSVALDNTNAESVSSFSVESSKAPTPAATKVDGSVDTTSAGAQPKNLIRRGGGGGGGGGRGSRRGRGGFSRPIPFGAAANESTIQTFSGASGVFDITPPTVPATAKSEPTLIDLTSSPSKNPAGRGSGSGGERDRGGFAEGRGRAETAGNGGSRGDDHARSVFGHKIADVEAAVKAKADATIAGLRGSHQSRPAAAAPTTTTNTPRATTNNSASTITKPATTSTPTLTKPTDTNTPIAKTATTPATAPSRYPAPPPPLKDTMTPTTTTPTTKKRKKKRGGIFPEMAQWKERVNEHRRNQSSGSGGGGRGAGTPATGGSPVL
ncbi:hypothetical protein IWZ03DRAFT_192776 [Phyllosticta citriasiana]|uniref:Shelterin complex subunit TPP1/Est3 domain-containing protein n=1 Tax=Phyllosticta citriasiana TaxID=595635 RepID=A0ABR1KL03_9PEZI